MRLSVEIKEMHFLFLVGVLAVVSAVGIVTGYGGTEPSVVGHTPGEITGGTFGAGNYVFPDNVTVNGRLGVGITPSYRFHVSGWSLFTGRVTSKEDFYIQCPTGFTSVESKGRQLGCIQDEQQAAATCQDAILDCFDNYGGKLPSYSDIYIAFQRFSSELSDEGTAAEWIDVGYIDYYWSTTAAFTACGLIDTSASSFRPIGTSYNENRAYRCWIPS